MSEHLEMFFSRFVDRCRTTNNMMGDCYCAAVVEALSRKVGRIVMNKMINMIIVVIIVTVVISQELDAMDQLNEKLRMEEEEKMMGPTLGMHKSPSTSSNGSRVAVPEEVMVMSVVLVMAVMVLMNMVKIAIDSTLWG